MEEEPIKFDLRALLLQGGAQQGSGRSAFSVFAMNVIAWLVQDAQRRLRSFELAQSRVLDICGSLAAKSVYVFLT